MTTTILVTTMIILLVLGVFLTIAVLLQHGKSHGLGTITGAAENFLGKEKGTRVDRMLARLTTILGCLFVVVVLLIYILQPNFRYVSAWQNFSEYYGQNTQTIVTETSTSDKKDDATEAATEAATSAIASMHSAEHGIRLSQKTSKERLTLWLGSFKIRLSSLEDNFQWI